MKRFALSSFIVFSIFACNKVECPDSPTPDAPAACSDEVPTNEACQAYFKRWFYIKESKSCEEIGYSGCSQKGFATKIECEACLER